MIGDMLKAQIVRLSYYNAGLKATDWEYEMGLIYSAGSGTFRQWKLLIGPTSVEIASALGCSSAQGSLYDGRRPDRCSGEPYSAADLRSMLKSLP